MNSSPLPNIDLTHDLAARRFFKVEIVNVEFAQVDGEIMSSVGRNDYRRGDALITGSNGDRWSVSRDRFTARYEVVAGGVPGQTGQYRARRQIVFAKQMATAFSIQRSATGDLLQGAAGDWLMQYAPGDFGIVDGARFASVYRRAN